MIIGICGKSGSGKSTLSREIINLSNNKAVHLDIDKVGHKVLTFSIVKEQLTNIFGSSILTNQNIDRKKLREIVFNSKTEMDKLSEVTWNYMQLEIDKFIEINKNKIIILDWLLLPTSKYINMCDLKILLDIPFEIRKERAMKRDLLSEEEFYLREQASIDFNTQIFDYVFQNNEQKNIKRLMKLL